MAFGKNRSIHLALLELTDEITNAIDNKKASIGVFIDFKKAYNTVNHNLLIQKLEMNSFHSIILKWLAI